MNSPSKKMWSKFWGKNLEMKESKIFNLIDYTLENLTDDEKELVLKKPLSLFRSISVVYRWIHYNFLREDEQEPEIVTVLDPTDLPNLDIKKMDTFIYGAGKTNKVKESQFKLGETKCPVCGNKKFLEDNRVKKKSEQKFSRIPDFSCSDFRDSNGCGWGGYIETNNKSNKVPFGWVKGDKENSLYDEVSREEFKSWCQKQIGQIDPKLLEKIQQYDISNSKLIKTYWNTISDYELIGKYKYTLENLDLKLSLLSNDSINLLERKIESLDNSLTEEESKSFKALVLSNGELREDILKIPNKNIPDILKTLKKSIQEDEIEIQKLKEKLIK